MKTYRIIVAYDGTDFFGWQTQPDAPTVTSCLQKTFEHVFGQTPDIFGASRTDSGVHALAQVARVRSDVGCSSESLLRAWNNALPKSILIRHLEPVDSSYDPRRGVTQKTYHYHLFYRQPLPFVARYGWFYDNVRYVEWNQFQEALLNYVGTHDFGSFCTQEGGVETVRTVDAIVVEKLKRYRAFRVTIKGKGFVRFQIRRMIGCALDVARRPDLTPEFIANLLENPDPRQALTKAGAEGLVLRKILYAPERSL